jgi:hypothetical protein
MQRCQRLWPDWIAERADANRGAAPADDSGAGGGDPLGQLQALLQQGPREQNLELIRDARGQIVGAWVERGGQRRMIRFSRDGNGRIANMQVVDAAPPPPPGPQIELPPADLNQMARPIPASLPFPPGS